MKLQKVRQESTLMEEEIDYLDGLVYKYGFGEVIGALARELAVQEQEEDEGQGEFNFNEDEDGYDKDDGY